MKKLIFPLLLLTGCTHPIMAELPVFNISYWQEADVTPDATVNHEWWNNFDDATLAQLIKTAKEQSPDAKIALSRIEKARAEESSIIANQFPIFSGGADAGRSKNSETLTGRTGLGKYDTNISTGFDAIWEVNPFKLEPALRAAGATRLKMESDYNHVLVTLFGDVAKNYFEIRKLQKQIKIANSNVKAADEIYELTQVLAKSGKVSEADSLAAKAEAASARATISPLNAALAAKIYQLEVLLGQTTGSLAKTLEQPAELKISNKNIELNSPASVLAQRPDVKAAEQNVKYAAALQDVAFASYYPSISMAGLLGLETGDLSKLFKRKSLAASISGGINVPIFDFGRIEADIKGADADAVEAVELYKKTVLNALAEVEIAANALAQEYEHYNQINIAFESSATSHELALERYKKGLDSYIAVLQSEKLMNANSQALAVSKADVLINQVRLYKALGGGWK